MIQVDQRSREPIYEQIITRIEELVMLGIYQKDDQLPSVRALAGELAINPNTIQKAYAILEQNGIIYSRQGRGSFIAVDQQALQKKRAPRLFAAFDQTLSELIQMHIQEDVVVDRVRQRYRNIRSEEVEKDDSSVGAQ